MYIYLISNSEYYKIGISKNPIKRIKQLQTGNSVNLILINQYYSPKYYSKIETALHYSYNNINLEWFELSIEQALEFTDVCRRIEANLMLIDKFEMI